MINGNAEGKISAWVGLTHKSLIQFNMYFKGMEGFDSGSPIQKDLGASFIDSDLFVSFMTKDGKAVPVEEICREIDCSRSTELAIIEACNNMHVTAANAFFYYINAEFNGKIGGIYNDLVFLGVFDDSQ